MGTFDASQSLGLYRLGQEDKLRAQQLAAAQQQMQERKSAIQAVIDARTGANGGGLGGYVKPSSDTALSASTMPENGFSLPDTTSAPSAAVGSSVPAMTVSPQANQGGMESGMIRLYAIDPETAIRLEDHFAKADQAVRNQWTAKIEAMGRAAYALSQIPLAQRPQAFASNFAPALIQAGWTPQELQQADLSDQGLLAHEARSSDFLKIMTEARQKADQDAGKVVPVEPGGTLVRVMPDGSSRTIAAPGGGSHPIPPAEAIAELKANPSTAAQFDEIFGPGASQQVLGGGAGNGTGSFRP